MSTGMKSTSAAVSIMAGTALVALAHCQIPCGIYDDDTRITLMREHVVTIEKSITEIERISKAAPTDNNQLVRWVVNKEAHADELAEIVTYYFMAQRIKPVPEDKKVDHAKYVKNLALLHRILVVSMKAKQATNLEHCTQLKALIDRFEQRYAGK